MIDLKARGAMSRRIEETKHNLDRNRACAMALEDYREQTETAVAAAPSTARKSAGGTFTVGGQEAPRNAASTGGPRAISSVDALIALQGVEDFRERKKRAVAKGRHALDMLDQIKLGLLDDTIDQGMLARLKVAADGVNEGSGDAGLDAVLGEIDLAWPWNSPKPASASFRHS